MRKCPTCGGTVTSEDKELARSEFMKWYFDHTSDYGLFEVPL